MGACCSGSVKATAPGSKSVSAGNASRVSDPISKEGPTPTVPGENKSSSLVAVVPDGNVVSSASAGPTGGPTDPPTTVPATEEAGAGGGAEVNRYDSLRKDLEDLIKYNTPDCTSTVRIHLLSQLQRVKEEVVTPLLAIRDDFVSTIRQGLGSQLLSDSAVDFSALFEESFAQARGFTRFAEFVEENITKLEVAEKAKWGKRDGLWVDAQLEQQVGSHAMKALLLEEEWNAFQQMSPVLLGKVPWHFKEYQDPDVRDDFRTVGPRRFARSPSGTGPLNGLSSEEYSFYHGLSDNKVTVHVLAKAEQPSVTDWKKAMCIHFLKDAMTKDNEEQLGNRVTQQMFRLLADGVSDADDLTAWIEDSDVIVVPSYRWIDILDDETGELLAHDAVLDIDSSDRYRMVIRHIPSRILNKDSPSDEWRDRDKVLRTIEGKIYQHNPNLYKLIGDNLKDDKELLLAALEHRPDNLSTNPTNDPMLAMVTYQRQDRSPLAYAGHNLRNDREVVKTAIQCSADAFLYASPALKADAEVALCAIREANGASDMWLRRQLFRHVPEALRLDKDFIIKVMRVNGSWFEYENIVPAVFKEDRDVVEAAVSSRGSLYGGPRSFSLRGDENDQPPAGWSHELLADRDIILAALSSKHFFLSFGTIPEEVFEDKEFTLKAIKAGGENLSVGKIRIPQEFFEDKEFTLEAIKAGGENVITLLPESVLQDSDTLDAVMSEKKSLINKEWSEELLSKKPEFAEYLDSVSLDNWPDVFDRKRSKGQGKGKAKLPWITYDSLPDVFRHDPDIFAATASKHPWGLREREDEEDISLLKKDRSVVASILTRTGAALEHVSDSFQNDHELVLAAVQSCGTALKHASADRKADLRIAVAAVRQDFKAYLHVDDSMWSG